MSSASKPHILIVDDTPQNIQVVAGVLHQGGYQMAFATNGQAALDSANLNRFDLILLDIMMPGMDGYEVCQKLKQDPKTCDVPVIFLTAKTDSDSIVKGFELGGVDYISKPFNAAELKARVKTHLRLKATERELRELNANKDKFISIIAHDLRGPFGSILGILKMLIANFKDFDADAQMDSLKTASQAADNFYKLLENLLTWARLQRGVMSLHLQQVDLGAAAFEMTYLFKAQAAAKGIEVVSGIPHGTLAHADAEMVKTVVRNLVSNALKFTPNGGKVEIACAPHDETYLEVSVSDNGSGMSADDLDKLFRIDVHFSRKGTAGEPGTGMGLVLCQDLVEKNGGKVWVESEEGKGTTFRFTLKKAAPPESQRYLHKSSRQQFSERRGDFSQGLAHFAYLL